jgi:hypothetical protein
MTSSLCCHWGTLMTGCLKERDAHPQQKDDDTYQSERYMKVKKAISQVAIGATKWWTKRLILRLCGRLHTHCSRQLGIL